MLKSKRICISLLSLVALLGACDKKPDTETGALETSKPTEGNQTTEKGTDTSVVKKDYTIDDLYNRILELEKGNFKVDYGTDENSYTDTYNENYCYIGFQDYGTVALDSYNETVSKDKLCYNFTYDESSDSYSLQTVAFYYDLVNGGNKTSNSTTPFNYLTYLDTYKDKFSFLKEGIIKEGNTFYVESYYCMMFFSYTLHIGNYFNYGSVARLAFEFDDKDNLLVKAQGKIDQIRYADIISSKFYDVGTATDPWIDSFFADGFKLPDTKPTTDEAKLLTGNDLTINGDVEYVSSELNPSVSKQGTVHNVYTEKGVYRSSVTIGNMDVNWDYTALKDDGTYKMGVDATNAVYTAKVSSEKEVLPSLKNVLDVNALRKTGENTFTYFGANLAEVVDALYGQNNSYRSFMSIGGVTFTLNNGVISHADVYYGDYFMPTTGHTYFHLSLNLTGDKTLPEMKPYENVASTGVKNAFKKFDGTSSYHVTIYDDSLSQYASSLVNYLDVTFDKDKQVTYIKKYVSGKLEEEYGYKKTEQGVIAFKKVTNADNTTSFVRTEKDDTSKDAFKKKAMFNISPETLVQSTSNKYYHVFRQKVMSLGEAGLVDTGNGAKNMADVSTAQFVLEGSDDNLSLKEMTYRFTPKGSNASTMHLAFKYGDTYKVDEDLTTIKEFVEPSSWNDESDSFVTRLTSLFGEDSKKIPYVYDAKLHGNFKFRNKGDTTAFYSRVENRDDYLEKYKEALVKAGFKKDDKTGQYVLNNIVVTVASTLKEGVTFAKKA